MNPPPPAISRRQWLRGTGAAAAAALLLPAADRFIHAAEAPATSASKPAERRYRIAASDWMMLKRQTPGALERASECALDGVEVDMGPLGKRPDFENKLREDEFRLAYLTQAKELGLALSSFAMSAFYGQPVADHPKAEHFCNDWIDLMPKIGTNVGFLPVIFKKDDERGAAVAKVVALMKKVAPKAQSAGVTVGLNTPLDADANIRLLDDIGSPAVRIAYNCGETID